MNQNENQLIKKQPPSGVKIHPETPLYSVEGNKLDELKKMYSEMLLIRRFEEACARSYAKGKIGGFCHLYIGQEAVGVGAINAVDELDYIVSTYRDHGHALARGLSPRKLMAELYGKQTGICGGKGGSMHFFDKSLNFMGGHGIVGGHVALAAGIGWAIKYRKEKGVVLCFFGDGAANIGAFHESLNLASLWNLPVIFICENNHYSMGTPRYRSLSTRNVSIRAVAYEMVRHNFQGDDVLKVKEIVKKYSDRAREGKGPALLEISTYRFRGHSMSDPAKYRTKEEVDTFKDRDPLLRARKILEMSGINESELEKIDEERKKEALDSVEFSENSEIPNHSSLYTNVISK